LAWTYNLQGELIKVPDEKISPQGLPLGDLAIQKIPCDGWGRRVWFSLDPDVLRTNVNRSECPSLRLFKNRVEAYNVVYEQDAVNCEKQHKGFHQGGFRG